MLVNDFGKLIAVDKATTNRERLDMARVLVQVSASTQVLFCDRARINGVMCNVRVAEEMLKPMEVCKCWR